jgi:aminoglycoside phosphotransferase (APT) family kinase protein
VTVTPSRTALRRLLRAQAPDLADLTLVPLAGGTETAIWRIGAQALGRFPLSETAAAGLAREVRWLDHLPPLPLAVPRLRCAGAPGEGYPFGWAVVDYIAGEDALAAPPLEAAAALAGLVAALWAAPVPDDLPRAEAGRLAPGALAFAREMAVRIRPGEGDPARLMALLSEAAALPAWQGAPVWSHGDLHPLNLIVQGGRLAGVIDWASLGAGDPARDLICAWTVLDRAGRARLRATLDPDPAAWARARAFALVMAVQGIPWHRDGNPRFCAAMRRTLAEVLADPELPG